MDWWISSTGVERRMIMASRIDVQHARRDLENPDGAMLVCAYDDDAKCKQYGVEGAVPYSSFKQREGAIPKDREVIFYCA
jgi:hypothetical protein